MRRLMLLRHAKAEKSKPGEADRARGLAERGRRDAPKLGAYMSRHALFPQRVIVSPAARARETWELVAETLTQTPLVVYDEHLYDATAEGVLKVIMTAGADAPSVMVVGHNPGLHDLARLLLAAGDVETRERLHEELPTTGLVVIDFPYDDWLRLHPHSGRLDRFVSPFSIEPATD
jgi:phosphohistidine phosphatase